MLSLQPYTPKGVCKLKRNKNMFDNLSDKLDKAMHVLKGHGQITEVNVAETLKLSLIHI